MKLFRSTVAVFQRFYQHHSTHYESIMGQLVFDGGTNTIVLFGGTLLDGSPDGSVFTFNCITKTWSGAGDFSVAQANGPVSDH